VVLGNLQYPKSRQWHLDFNGNTDKSSVITTGIFFVRNNRYSMRNNRKWSIVLGRKFFGTN
jgi:hypothetical protein